jgi:hypothetical protein
MITIFAIPKPFRGHIKIIQRNAIESWTKLQPKPEIILFGDDEGTIETAQEFGLRSIPAVAKNSFGTPYISDVFVTAQREAKQETLCYVNSDIIFGDDLIDAIKQITFERYLMIGQRWNLNISEPLDFTIDWQTELNRQVHIHGELFNIHALDYFVFRRGTYSVIPPFLVGRPTWDNWIIYHTLLLRIPVIDATEGIIAVHQNHDYSHIPLGSGSSHEGPEADYNRKLWNPQYPFNVEDATYSLSTKGLRRDLRFKRLKKGLDTFSVLHPKFGRCLKYPRKIISLLFLKPLRKLSQLR